MGVPRAVESQSDHITAVRLTKKTLAVPNGHHASQGFNGVNGPADGPHPGTDSAPVGLSAPARQPLRNLQKAVLESVWLLSQLHQLHINLFHMTNNDKTQWSRLIQSRTNQLITVTVHDCLV